MKHSSKIFFLKKWKKNLSQPHGSKFGIRVTYQTKKDPIAHNMSKIILIGAIKISLGLHKIYRQSSVKLESVTLPHISFFTIKLLRTSVSILEGMRCSKLNRTIIFHWVKNRQKSIMDLCTVSIEIYPSNFKLWTPWSLFYYSWSISERL